MKKLYKLWNRTDKINGLNADVYLSSYPFKNYNGDIILVYLENGVVIQVENKELLAQLYNIDILLPLDDFMAEYFRKVVEAEDIDQTQEQ